MNLNTVIETIWHLLPIALALSVLGIGATVATYLIYDPMGALRILGVTMQKCERVLWWIGMRVGPWPRKRLLALADLLDVSHYHRIANAVDGLCFRCADTYMDRYGHFDLGLPGIYEECGGPLAQPDPEFLAEVDAIVVAENELAERRMRKLLDAVMAADPLDAMSTHDLPDVEPYNWKESGL